jgi:nitrite reductase/ring-hydroxylating ferredoxin subunit
MRTYRDDPAALERLVQPDRVHRDVYLDRELFELEMERLWARAWVYACHASQLPNEGDYVTLELAGKPLIVLRQADGSIRVLVNRCAHKGTKLTGELSGNAGKTLRCPYHAWTYRLDGSILNIPLREGYDGTRLGDTEACRGLTACRTSRPTAGSCSCGFRRTAWDFASTSANRSPPSTTSPTARPRASSRSRAAACAISTTATGRCSSRT